MIAEAMIMIDEDYDEDHNNDEDGDNHPVRLLFPTGQPLLVRCAPFIGIKMVVRLLFMVTFMVFMIFMMMIRMVTMRMITIRQLSPLASCPYSIHDNQGACCHVQVHGYLQDIHDTDDDNADNFETDNNRI